MASTDAQPTRRSQYAEETRAALVRAARELFTEKGYAATGTEEILQRANASRGAMYHHFAGKKELFRAALEVVEEEFITQLDAGGAPGTDVFDEICNGCQLFLDIATEPSIQRMMLIDGPSVLGWIEWRAIEERYGFGLLRAYLAQAMEQGLIEQQPIESLTNVLAGAMNEAAILVANAEDRDAARRDVGDSIARLLSGLRVAQGATLRVASS
jgi:AcrR family transcriptional regulator